uniref:Uncharacterized protein n=1 Tax=Arundo donax TaxID=35708 RepID=A0A0A9G2T0_ARUDO
MGSERRSRVEELSRGVRWWRSA